MQTTVTKSDMFYSRNLFVWAWSTSFHGPFLMMFLSFSFAATSSAVIPGSLAECPASGTTCPRWFHMVTSSNLRKAENEAMEKKCIIPWSILNMRSALCVNPMSSSIKIISWNSTCITSPSNNSNSNASHIKWLALQLDVVVICAAKH